MNFFPYTSQRDACEYKITGIFFVLPDRENENEVLKFFENTFFLILNIFLLPNVSFWFSVNILLCLTS